MKAPIDLLAGHLRKHHIDHDRIGDDAIVIRTTDGVTIMLPKGVATMTSIHVATEPDAVSEVRIDELGIPVQGATR